MTRLSIPRRVEDVTLKGEPGLVRPLLGVSFEGPFLGLVARIEMKVPLVSEGTTAPLAEREGGSREVRARRRRKRAARRVAAMAWRIQTRAS